MIVPLNINACPKFWLPKFGKMHINCTQRENSNFFRFFIFIEIRQARGLSKAQNGQITNIITALEFSVNFWRQRAFKHPKNAKNRFKKFYNQNFFIYLSDHADSTRILSLGSELSSKTKRFVFKKATKKQIQFENGLKWPFSRILITLTASNA